MPAKVICMASAKGGSGKTVLTATFGSFLCAIGKRILLIDTDASTNGLTLLYLKEVMTRGEIAIAGDRRPRGSYEISERYPFPEIVELPNGCHLIPATYKFSNTEQGDPVLYEWALTRVLMEQRDNYDCIFLDAQAGSDAFAHVAMSRKVSNEVIIVSEYDPMSAAGVERLKGLFREDLTYVRTWVLLNKMLPEFVKSFSDFLEVAKYLSPIPWDPDVVRAYARRKIALDLEKGNEHTLAVMQTLQGLLGDEVASEITKWAKGRESAIRQPIEEQYHDLEKELQGLLETEKRITAKRVQRTAAAYALISVCGSAFFALLLLSDSVKSRLEGLFGTSISVTAVAIIAGVPLLASMAALLRGHVASLGVTSDTEEMRLERQKSILEERLKKLEALRQADLQSLIKHKRLLI